MRKTTRRDVSCARPGGMAANCGNVRYIAAKGAQREDGPLQVTDKSDCKTEDSFTRDWEDLLCKEWI